jgi:hypothetical protein
LTTISTAVILKYRKDTLGKEIEVMRPTGGIFYRKASIRKRFNLWQLIVGPVLIFIGLVFVLVGLLIELNTLIFLQGAISTHGVIVSCEMITSSEGSTSGGTTKECQPKFQFQTRAGRKVTVQDMSSSSSWSQGDIVTVDYHSNDPQDARIEMGLFWLIFVVIGSFFILVGGLIFLRWWLSSRVT